MLKEPIPLAYAFKAFLVVGCLSVPDVSLAIEPVEVRLVSDSTLPEGLGIAKKFSSDSGTQTSSSVIFADNFEAEPLQAKWDSVTGEGDTILSLTDETGSDEFLGKHSLMVRATLGQNNGGGLTKWYEPVDQVFVRFYVKFDKNCDYIHHFSTLRANKSWQGGDRWSGFGGAGVQPDGITRFSTAIEPWGDFAKWPAPGKWHFYTYWPDMKSGPDGKYWGSSFKPQDQPLIEKDKWICVEFMLKHNTPNQYDGEQAYWIDGKLLGHWQGFRWRTSPTLQANAFTLENYVTDLWTKHKENIVYFDNVVIAKEYIGPSVAKWSTF